MAKMLQGIFGGVSGKIGNTIGSSWKGIPVIKTKPLSVANPRTSAQVNQRTNFKNCVAFASSVLSSIIKPLWDRFAIKQSGYNAFVGLNTQHFTTPTLGGVTDVLISRGKMQPTLFTADNVSSAENQVHITWSDDSGEGYKLASDLAYAVVLNADTEEVATASATATRADGEITVNMSSNLALNENSLIWLAFARADGTVVSNSHCVVYNSAP